MLPLTESCNAAKMCTYFGAFAGLSRYFHQNAKVSLNVSLKGVDFKREEVHEEMRIYNITHFSVLALENF